MYSLRKLVCVSILKSSSLVRNHKCVTAVISSRLALQLSALQANLPSTSQWLTMECTFNPQSASNLSNTPVELAAVSKNKIKQIQPEEIKKTININRMGI